MNEVAFAAGAGLTGLLVEESLRRWEARIERRTSMLVDVERRALDAIGRGRCTQCEKRQSKIVRLFDQDGAS